MLRASDGPDMKNGRKYWIVVTALLLLTRVGASARFLSVDNVNLAFALEYFDPLNHQPQPPGYPLFVLVARLVNYLIGSVEVTFLFLSILATGLCLFVTAALGKRMFSEWSGKAAVLLLLVNPVFWETGATSPLRPFLGLFSLLTAYCAWRCWHGEARYALWGAVCVGVGAGFRPELLPILFPLWFVSAFVGTRSIKTVAVGMSVLAAIVLAWTAGLVIAVGGVQSLAKLLSDYVVDQSQRESLVMGASLRGWLRQVGRIASWNGTAVFWWIWAVPFLFARHQERRNVAGGAALFVAVWIVPGLVLQALVHGDAPGHTLFSVPALCLVGAHVMMTAAKRFERFEDESNAFRMREAWFAGSLVVSVMIFLNFFPMPKPVATPGGRPSVVNTLAFAVNEATLGSVRAMDNVAFATLEELRRFTPAGRPSVIVSNDLAQSNWFLNWRILRYYEPTREIWAIADSASPRTALRVKRYGSLESVTGDPVPITVPKGGRVLWILEPLGTFEGELRENIAVFGGRYVVYSDLPDDAVPFKVAGFEFRPQ
jgi:4-amino-4-deoxy-L-arabinose transferase-like glycosyltransferase